MSDVSEQLVNGQSPEGSADREERRARRQQRLRQLAGAGQGAAATGGQGDAAPRQAVLQRALRLLTDTPAGDAGMVPGTSFTQAGVAAFVAELRKRSENEGARGARVASRIMTVLQPGEGEEQVQGVSVQKLQRLSKRADGALGVAAGGGRRAGVAGGGRGRRSKAG